MLDFEFQFLLIKRNVAILIKQREVEITVSFAPFKNIQYTNATKYIPNTTSITRIAREKTLEN